MQAYLCQLLLQHNYGDSKQGGGRLLELPVLPKNKTLPFEQGFAANTDSSLLASLQMDLALGSIPGKASQLLCPCSLEPLMLANSKRFLPGLWLLW